VYIVSHQYVFNLTNDEMSKNMRESNATFLKENGQMTQNVFKSDLQYFEPVTCVYNKMLNWNLKQDQLIGVLYDTGSCYILHIFIYA